MSKTSLTATDDTISFGRATVLVTGGAGFIGSHFIRRLLARHPGIRVVNFDKLTYCGNPDNLADIAGDSRYVFVRGDIADRAALDRMFDTHHPRYVINFAAESHVDRSIHGDAEDFIHTNIIGTAALLGAARRGGAEKFVQVSTDEVYGDLPLDSAARFDEASPLRPSSPYAASKAAGDMLCLAHARTYGVPVVITRSGNNYGSHQYPEKLIPFFVMRADAGDTMPLYGDGMHVRDWVFVGDHCAALERVLLAGVPGEIYNIGAGSERSNHDIAAAIADHIGIPRSRMVFVADRPGHDRRYALDFSKIGRELGWAPSAAFEDELEKTIRWYRDNKSWVENILRRARKINPHIA
jgi:dTDP-glucose 4,6-dehydratase